MLVCMETSTKDLRSFILRVRLNDSEKIVAQSAARLKGLSLSAYGRMIIREAAASDLRSAGREVSL
jgi:hypothetical protein